MIYLPQIQPSPVLAGSRPCGLDNCIGAGQGGRDVETIMLFDDLLAAAMLYVDSWEHLSDGDGIGAAYALLKDELRGTSSLTSMQRERLYRDAAIREAARRGEPYLAIADRYCLSPSAVAAIARAGGERRRAARMAAEV